MTLSRQDLPRTYSARFNIRNLGSKTHNFTLGATLDGKGTVVSRVVKPRSHAVAYFLQNDTRGVLRYYSSVPTDRKKRAMQGSSRSAERGPSRARPLRRVSGRN
jgi:hypothetical protein